MTDNSNTMAGAATTGQAAGLTTQAEPNWWWDYAEMKAPEHNEMYYFKFTLLSISYFLMMHLILHLLFRKHFAVYREMTGVKMTEYRTYWTSIFHAIGGFTLAIIAMFYICGDGKTVFNNDECMNTPRYIHVWALLHTNGYMLQDFAWVWFHIKGNSALDWQTYAHHLVAVITFYQTLYFMDFMMVFGVMLLFTEVSSVFVSTRYLLFTHGYAETIFYAVNAILLFLSFFFCRIIYEAYIILFIGLPWVYREYQKKNLTLYQASVVTELITMVILSYVLNFHWFKLMCKMILRVINRSLAA